MTPAERDRRVGELLGQARVRRAAAAVAFAECDTLRAADFQEKAGKDEDKANDLDPEHLAPAWHTDREGLREDLEHEPRPPA